jgi:hypothetical protein
LWDFPQNIKSKRESQILCTEAKKSLKNYKVRNNGIKNNPQVIGNRAGPRPA